MRPKSHYRFSYLYPFKQHERTPYSIKMSHHRASMSRGFY